MFEATLHNLLHDDNLTLLFVVKFGSHLYGTDTATSDEDYKGVYLPNYEDVLLNRVSKSLVFDTNRTSVKNTEDDVDFEVYSLHYFFELAKKGETVAIDMLHANKASIVYTSPLWEKVAARRSMFYTKNMKALVGYARKQAAKYGMKGSRITSAETLRNFLEASDPEARMFEYWKKLPTDENMFHKPQAPGGVPLKCMEFVFCGKIIQSTVTVQYALDMVKAFENQYGHRAKKAAKDGGTDWKAISHALRAALQLREIFETGDLKFPLATADYLRTVKGGGVPIEDALEVLESQISAVEKLAMTAEFPETVNKESVDEFLLRLLLKEYKDA